MQLYDLFFHFNPYQNKWYAVPRTHIHDYFNGNFRESIQSDPDILNLIERVQIPAQDSSTGIQAELEFTT